MDILDFTYFLLDFGAISNFWLSHNFGKILPNFSSKLQLVYKPVGSVCSVGSSSWILFREEFC